MGAKWVIIVEESFRALVMIFGLISAIDFKARKKKPAEEDIAEKSQPAI